MVNETGIHDIPFNKTPVKSPDASPHGFCSFGLMKRTLGDRSPRTLSGSYGKPVRRKRERWT